MRNGGFSRSMVRICTGDVCVRSSRRSRGDFWSCPARKSVSCMSRAGWFGGKFRTQRVADARKADVEALAFQFAGGRAALDSRERGVDGGLNFVFEFVD